VSPAPRATTVGATVNRENRLVKIRLLAIPIALPAITSLVQWRFDSTRLQATKVATA